jgi:hypothetical protein
MEKLIKPVEYAHRLGISRQAVYAKIKRGILQSRSVDGKLYIVIDEAEGSGKAGQKEEISISAKGGSATALQHPVPEKSVDYESLLEAKDETIHVLKETVKDLKESNQQMSTTLRGEIDLLKEAFHEMRTLYVTRIEQNQRDELEHFPKAIEVTTVEQVDRQWIGLKKFFRKYSIDKAKKQKNAIKRFKKALKKGDPRILEEGGEIRLKKKERFRDLLK